MSTRAEDHVFDWVHARHNCNVGAAFKRLRRLAGAKSVEAGPKGGSGSAKSAPSLPKLRPEEDREALLEERSELLRSIAVLDDELDAGKIQKSEHERKRSALKLRAVELTRKIGKP